MFVPIDRLPGRSDSDATRYEERWNSQRGQRDKERVLTLIREGAGEDFLQQDFEAGQLPTLEDMWDLRGFQIQGESFRFPGGDTFEAINFSFGSFWHTTFENAVFQTAMRFGRIYGCTFTRCIFIYCGFSATTFEECQFVDCDFIEGAGFTNCDFRSVTFQGCYIGVPIFDDCRFDRPCHVGPSVQKPVRGFNVTRDPRMESSLFTGISEAYRSGGARDRARDTLFLALCAQTRHNQASGQRLLGYVKEALFGYGLRPMRVLITLAGVVALGTAGFALRMPLREAFLLAAGAVFTFGVHADSLDKLPSAYSFGYIALAFAGISLVALFTVVWARVLFVDD